VFLDGCFWHGCPDHHTVAATNAEYWERKVAANRARDADTDRQLTEEGWLTVRFWEHEAPEAAAAKVQDVVRARRRQP
jgi:DNA mismatch endonuclease (patch repair protein)